MPPSPAMIRRSYEWGVHYQRGHSIRKIANHYGVTYQAVRQALRRNGIIIRGEPSNPQQIRADYSYQIQASMIPIAAYLAGMIDGDGHIRTAKGARAEKGSTQGSRAEVTITNSYRPLIEWAADQVGINVYERLSRYRGTSGVRDKGHVCPPECSTSHVHQRKPMYRWIVRGERGLIVLKGVLPYLIEKQDRALEAIQIQEAQKTVRWVRQTYEEMFDLGWLS